MKIFDQAITYITSLTDKDFQKQLIALLSIVSIVVCGIVFFVYRKSSTKISHIKQIHKLAQKAAVVLSNNARIEKEEKRIEKILIENKDFNIKSYFEQFCREHDITPEPGWDTTTNPIETNEKFDEVLLPATFKNQTTKTLAPLLEDLDKKEIVYIKELTIKKEEDTITFDLTIATKKPRRVL